MIGKIVALEVLLCPTMELALQNQGLKRHRAKILHKTQHHATVPRLQQGVYSAQQIIPKAIQWAYPSGFEPQRDWAVWLIRAREETWVRFRKMIGSNLIS